MGAPKSNFTENFFDYEFFAEFMKNHSGVNLPRNEKNEALVLNRVSKVLRVLKLGNFEELKEKLQSQDPKTLVEFIGNLTTHKTHFFREDAHFTFFKQHLAEHFKKKSDLRVWCAAASSGQEPYTIAIVLQETLGAQKKFSTRFLATDIDQQVLHQASQGFYTPNEMEGLSETFQKKYFQTAKKGDKSGHLAKKEIRDWIHFAPLNLTQKDYGFQHKFDVIFCRNVLIYFDADTTNKVVEKLTQCLNLGGYLILGHSESGVIKNASLKNESHAVFKKVK